MIDDDKDKMEQTWRSLEEVFDWPSVFYFMKHHNWFWQNGTSSPSIIELKRCAKHLFIYVYEGKSKQMSAGGFTMLTSNGEYELDFSFTVAIASVGSAKDKYFTKSSIDEAEQEAPDFIIYGCRFCGGTVRQPNCATYRVNTMCGCKYPDMLVQMQPMTFQSEPPKGDIPNE